MNKGKLKSKMLDYGDSAETLAKFLDIHRSCLSAKMNQYRGASFTQKEIKMIIDRYSLSADEAYEIFFA